MAEREVRIRCMGFTTRCALLILLLLSTTLVSAETFHAIIIGETSDPNIKGSVQTDTQLAENFAREVGRHFESASITLLTGANASKPTVKNTIASLDIEHDDFVFIFYSGHGDQSAVDAPWPNMSLLGGSLEGRDLLLQLAEQQSPRHLVVFDACNGASEMPITRLPASTGFKPQQINRLFKEIAGSIIITSSEPGYVSYADSGGGASRFSRAFIEVMNNTMTATQKVPWSELLEKVKVRTETFSDVYRQVPKYSLTPGI